MKAEWFYLFGMLAITAGVGLFSLPAGLIVFGLFCLLLGIALSARRSGTQA